MSEANAEADALTEAAAKQELALIDNLVYPRWTPAEEVCDAD